MTHDPGQEPSLADLIHATGLPLNYCVADVPDLTWHVTNPLKGQGIVSLRQLAELDDQDVLTRIGPEGVAKLRMRLTAAAQIAGYDASSATETPVQPEVGSQDDRTSETPTETLLDADTLNAAADRLDALPPGGQALTGPYWYGQGMKDAVNILRDWAVWPKALGPINGALRLDLDGPLTQLLDHDVTLTFIPAEDIDALRQRLEQATTVLNHIRAAIDEFDDGTDPAAVLAVVREQLDGDREIER